jgi:uncharacterized protein with HEPN domain
VPFDTLAQPLEDILEHIARIEQFVANLDEGQFRNDTRTVFAVHHALAVIGAVAVRLGNWAEVLSPDVPWDRMRELGTRLRPGSAHIDPSVLWRTVVDDLAPLQAGAMRALDQLEDHER